MAHNFLHAPYVFHVDNIRTVRNTLRMDMPSTPETYVDRIVREFGGISAMARHLGHRNVSTVQGWKDRGSIPDRQKPEVLAKAREMNLPLDRNDFFPVMPSPTSNEAAA